MKRFRLTGFIAIVLCTVLACKNDSSSNSETEFKVNYEKFTLDNGLEVLLHIDRSDPVVAVSLTAHVGSAREIVGRTGFAHLFEHLLFLESENLGKGGLDKMTARIGGSGANGSTSRDRTNYLQTVPKDALEKMIWAEADKLGYFINTVTEPVLAKEKQVVKNEKRQRVDNSPYGHTQYVIDQNLYPKGHPYSWQVIGSLEDLQNATLQDVKDFFNRWYVPNNVILTIAGDFDVEQTKAWVKKYFDEIPRGEDIPKLAKQPAILDASKHLYYEDNFARAPRLTMVWPGVPQYHEDSYALNVLSQYLTNGKKAPLYKVLVEDEQLTSNVGMGGYNSEISGQIQLSVTAFNQVDLNDLAKAFDKGFKTFEENGISETDLNRIKAGQETNFYGRLSSVLGKGSQLTQYEMFAGDAGYISDEVNNILAVTPEDVMRVYNTYIKGKNYIATSFVPRGQKNLTLVNSELAEIVEEQIVDGAEENFDSSIAATYEKTPSSFDRSIEPPYGESPDVKVPEVWKENLDSGIKVLGIENSEVPLVQFQMQIKGGMLLENKDKIGVSNLLASLMTRGTANKTPEQLENEIESLGARINAFASNDAIFISGNSLSKNFDATMALVSEILLEPRWDAKEFELLKQSTKSRIQRIAANPNAIAANEYNKILYGENHILANNNIGTESSLESITIDDLKAYYNTNISPNLASMHIVGDISQSNAIANLESINANWEVKDITLPNLPEVKQPAKSTVYFYDVPNAKQSVLRFGYPAPKATDKDYYAATVMNYRLGGGGFASQLTQQLREGKGYTYGIRSGFTGNDKTGSFAISSGVRSNVTYESTALVKEILENYGKDYDSTDLAVTKGFTIKSNARAFETLGAKLNMLSNISNNGLADDYAKSREAIVKALTIEDMKALAEKYITPDQMIYLVVGDAATQLDKLEKLGFGKPVLLNPEYEGLDQ
ncbi:M16 family metallopeptidase [Winogradskyella immobilis]|uniref:Insulinase family protein n=1 Tax=Winogradskyella immobilis TaxID=2816852 RepID=A0ABS8EPM5_9FLAO|nr:pitrilysin family protein [Winogradskyella immobilis]MCC1485174.1 insulinase family protein [Winogradskyella immobilis]MCG0017266.1 insulinase family protein [Winogradskyella immobilis]